MAAKKVSDSETIMTQLVMPNDTNPLGNLMGGNLMKWMDVAGGICAARHSSAHVVTASVDHISFSKPIHLGDTVTIKAMVTRAFTTSVEVFIEVFASDIKGENWRKANHAYFLFVALDDDMKPMKVPPVMALTTEEQNRYEAAMRRRDLRLILSGRMQPKDSVGLVELFSKDKA